MDMLRVTMRWGGFQGSPGFSNYYFAGGGGLISDAQQVADRTRGAHVFLATMLPAGVTLSLDPEVAVITAETGEIQDYRTVTPGGTITGTGTGNWSAASGAVVNWRTGDVRFGRRIRGRTFLVPLANTAFDVQGTLSTAALTAINQYAGGIIGGDLDSEFGVWSRPRDGEGGVFATAVSATIPDKVAVLRSRRD